jgi:putative tryptophan/tyrosine transport system substrate-binding protein
MRRRSLSLLLISGLLKRRTASAQQSRVYRVGWLSTAENPQLQSFRDGLRAFGYVEGQNLKLEIRDAGNRVETLPALAAGLEKDGVDIIVAVGITAATPAKASANRTPIVFITNDPVGRGLAGSLARPGGNLTGIEMMVVDFGSKWVEFLHELVPHASRFIAVAEAKANTQQIKTVQDAVGKVGGELTVVQIEQIDALDDILRGAVARGSQGLFVLSSAVFHGNRAKIVRMANAAKVPAIYEHRDFVVAGGLMSYGPDVTVLFRRLAYFVDRILKGANPDELPIEQPSKFEFVINKAAAQQLDLVIPSAVLARADEVI